MDRRDWIAILFLAFLFEVAQRALASGVAAILAATSAIFGAIFAHQRIIT